MSIAVFSSGSGSNFQSLIKHAREEKWPVPISLLISDRPGAKVLERAAAWDVPHFVFDPSAFASKADYEQEVLKLLQQHQIEWILLAGYMRIVGPTLLNVYEGKILNIHPSLLPAFPGKNSIEDAFRYPVKVTGVTIHYIDEGIDTGPIIAQEAVTIDPDETLESLIAKIHQVEHRLYPQVVRELIQGGNRES